MIGEKLKRMIIKISSAPEQLGHLWPSRWRHNEVCALPRVLPWIWFQFLTSWIQLLPGLFQRTKFYLSFSSLCWHWYHLSRIWKVSRRNKNYFFSQIFPSTFCKSKFVKRFKSNFSGKNDLEMLRITIRLRIFFYQYHVCQGYMNLLYCRINWAPYWRNLKF